MEHVNKFGGKSPEKLFTSLFLLKISSNPCALPCWMAAEGAVTVILELPHMAHRLNEVLYIFVLSDAFLQKHVTGSKSNMYS